MRGDGKQVFFGMFGDAASPSCHSFVRGKNRFTKTINGKQSAGFVTESNS